MQLYCVKNILIYPKMSLGRYIAENISYFLPLPADKDVSFFAR